MFSYVVISVPLIMTLLFRSKSCKLGVNSVDSVAPPPSHSVWDDYEEETEDDDEEEEEDYDNEIDDFEPYNPISTPFISPGFGKERENGGGGGGGGGRGGGGGGQFPILDFVVAALRKSIITCSVEREDASSLDISCPSDVRHISHVTFDRFDGFLGLPAELQPEVPRRVPSAR